MNFQSTSIGRSAVTLTTQRDVRYAHGHTGSQKNSRSAMATVYPTGAWSCTEPVLNQSCELSSDLGIDGVPVESFRSKDRIQEVLSIHRGIGHERRPFVRGQAIAMPNAELLKEPVNTACWTASHCHMLLLPGTLTYRKFVG